MNCNEIDVLYCRCFSLTVKKVTMFGSGPVERDKLRTDKQVD